MHPLIYAEFERICAERGASGRVLEIGSLPTDDSLLRLRALAGADEKVGINLDGPHDCGDFRILRGNANDMDCFEDASFDVVLCNATLEHDSRFWSSIEEIRRVTRSGGLIAIGVPGFLRHRRWSRFQRRLRRAPLIGRLAKRPWLGGLFSGTLTFEVHAVPNDYYRFSVAAVEEILLAGCREIEVRTLLMPPRIVGSGIKQ